jgi:hypothetical protein
MKALKATLTVAAFLCSFAVGARANATAGFPSEIETHLGLQAGAISMIAPPDGCHLCHINGSSGGDPLTAFGTLMKSSGAVKNENATVDGALDALQASNPNIIADLKSGMDPNLDQDAGTVNVGLTPHYGCGSVSAGRASLPRGGVLLVGMAAVLGRRRLKTRVKQGTPTSDHRDGRNDRAGALVARRREVDHDRRCEGGSGGRKRDGRGRPCP